MESDLHLEKVATQFQDITLTVISVTCGNVWYERRRIHVNMQVIDIWLCSGTLKGKGQNK